MAFDVFSGGGLADAASFLAKGGPVMVPILLVSLIGLAVAIERCAAFARFRSGFRRSRRERETALGLMREGRFDEARETSSSSDTAVCRIYAAALQQRGDGFEAALEDAAKRETARLRRGLSLLDTAVTVAPMLGILGTVTGIIQTFGALNASGGDAPQAATAGIGEALITTAAGLVVAILCLLPFNALRSQLRRAAETLELAGNEALRAFARGRARGGKGA